MRKVGISLLTLLMVLSLGLSSGLVSQAKQMEEDNAVENARVGGNIVLNPIFNDHMVIQREKPIVVSGSCSSADSVTVSFGGQTRTAQVKSGTFSITLPAMKANTKSQTMEITAGRYKETVEDILIGDVWFCSGQSNMQWVVQDLTKKYREMYEAIQNNTMVRHFFVPIGHQTTPQTDFLEKNTYWSVPDANEIQCYSAYAFSFAARVQQATGVPVGIINCACGGTQIQHWLSKEGQKLAGITFGENFFNAMVNPMKGIAVKGILWYQGESNINLPDSYTKLFKAYAESYREFFADEDLPIITTQLPRYTASEYPKWPQFRLEQWHIAAQMENVEIVCGIDLGVPTFNIHPSDKFIYGTRAAELALNTVYGLDTPGTSAYPDSINVAEDGILLGFSNAESGLKIQDGRLKELRLVKKDGSSVTAAGEVVNGSFLKITNGTTDVKEIQYCMSTIPEGTLFTQNGLPVAPFDLTIQEAPTGLSGCSPSSVSKKDGTITGVTTNMEYRGADKTTYMACSGNTISGLASGTYYVRQKVSGNNIALDAKVVVPEYKPGTIVSKPVNPLQGTNSEPTSSIFGTTISSNETPSTDESEESQLEQSTISDIQLDVDTNQQDDTADKPSASPVIWIVLGVVVLLAVVGVTVFFLMKKRWGE